MHLCVLGQLSKGYRPQAPGWKSQLTRGEMKGWWGVNTFTVLCVTLEAPMEVHGITTKSHGSRTEIQCRKRSIRVHCWAGESVCHSLSSSETDGGCSPTPSQGLCHSALLPNHSLHTYPPHCCRYLTFWGENQTEI